MNYVMLINNKNGQHNELTFSFKKKYVVIITFPTEPKNEESCFTTNFFSYSTNFFPDFFSLTHFQLRIGLAFFFISTSSNYFLVIL
jgi:hypothetical protein